MRCFLSAASWRFGHWTTSTVRCAERSHSIYWPMRRMPRSASATHISAHGTPFPPARPDPLRAYIIKIVRNLSVKAYRTKRAVKRSGYTVALEELDECIADKKTVEDTVEAAELGGIIERFLDTLSAKERVIFMRRYAFADSYAEIAERVGVSEKNVSVRLSVTRQKLRQFLIEKEVLQ